MCAITRKHVRLSHVVGPLMTAVRGGGTLVLVVRVWTSITCHHSTHVSQALRADVQGGGLRAV